MFGMTLHEIEMITNFGGVPSATFKDDKTAYYKWISDYNTGALKFCLNWFGSNSEDITDEEIDRAFEEVILD